MIEILLEYGGVIFAAVGIICLFLEAFEAFRGKSNTKLSFAGLACLTVSVIGFLVTDVILRDADIPKFVSIIWLVLLWAYLVCNIVSAVIISRKKRVDKSAQQDEQDTTDELSDEQKEQNVDVDDKQ